MAGTVCQRIGAVVAGSAVVVTGLSGAVVVKSDISELKAAWQAPLKDL